MKDKRKFVLCDILICIFAVAGNVLLYSLFWEIAERTGNSVRDYEDIKVLSVWADIIYNIIFVMLVIKYIKSFKKIGLGCMYSAIFVIWHLIFNMTVIVHAGNDWNAPAIFMLLASIYLLPILFIITAIIYFLVLRRKRGSVKSD